MQDLLKNEVFPLVISASRRSDIPAFYFDWLIKSFEERYLLWKNPFNPLQQKVIHLNSVKCIVFWTKNPGQIINKLKYFNNKNIHYYFLYTINGYDAQFEPYMLKLEDRINIFKKLVESIGLEKVIWRFDPIIITNDINEQNIYDDIYKIGSSLKGFTKKLILSFIQYYPKVKKRFLKNQIQIKEITNIDKDRILINIGKICEEIGIEALTCAEEINMHNEYKQFGIIKNKCIDDELMKSLFYNDLDFIKALTLLKKDKGQRKACGCITSIDIGQYNTCKFNCLYCYAI